MNIADLNEVPIKRKRRKRVGRGSGSGMGKTAGRGNKGDQSRTGYRRRFGFEGGQMPLYRRLPKKGFNNRLFRTSYDIVNTGQLNVFADGAEVDLAVLQDAGLIKHSAVNLKVLAKGALSRKLTIKAQKFSQTARQMIESAGGSVLEIA